MFVGVRGGLEAHGEASPLRFFGEAVPFAGLAGAQVNGTRVDERSCRGRGDGAEQDDEDDDAVRFQKRYPKPALTPMVGSANCQPEKSSVRMSQRRFGEKTNPPRA